MPIKTSFFILLCCLLFSSRSYGQGQRDTLFYQISPKMIDQARIDSVNMSEKKYYVHIRLKKAYRAKYAQLTEDNIGNFLAIVNNDKIIAPFLPIIKAKVPGGRFPVGPFKNEERAMEVLQQITNRDE